MDIIRLFDEDKGDKPKEPRFQLTLGLPQIWVILATGCSIMASAFYFGTLYNSHLTKAELERKQIEVERKDLLIARLQSACPVEEKKKTFLTLTKRLDNKHRAAAQAPNNKALQKEVKAAAQELAKFIDDNVDKNPDESGVALMKVDMNPEDPAYSKIIFRGDPEPYDVANGVKKLTKNATWVKASATPLENVAEGLMKGPARKADGPARTFDDGRDELSQPPGGAPLRTPREQEHVMPGPEPGTRPHTYFGTVQP